jgi:polar amino acid transport system permease protein
MDDTPAAAPVDRTPAPRATRKWQPAPPKSAIGLATAALVAAAATVALGYFTAWSIHEALVTLEFSSLAVDVALYGLATATLALFVPALRGFTAAKRAHTLIAGDIAEARATTADAKEKSWIAVGYSVAATIVFCFGLFVVSNDIAVGRIFLDFEVMGETFHLVVIAFWQNIQIFVIAEILVLIWGLLIAVARLAPGRAGAPVRLIATAYVDLFRGLPAIISIYLVGFGLPSADLPVLRDMTPTMFAILALTLTYGAYVSEVYRSGIESVHWSQTAAARSLGFTHGQTLRFVVVPQALRRIIPPLLNDFISLQKDTSLVLVLGTIDAFNQSKIIAANHFSLSAVTVVAVLFVLITIPQGRLVDKLVERDQKRMRTGG